MIFPSPPFYFGGPVSGSLASCFLWPPGWPEGGPRLGIAAFPLPPHLLPEIFQAQLLFSFLPRGFRWRKKPLLHNAQALLRRGKAETGTRWGTSSGWKGGPAKDIRLTSPDPFEIRSRLPFLSTPSLGDCRALVYFSSPNESAAHAGLLKCLKLFPSTEAIKLQTHVLASNCQGRGKFRAVKGWILSFCRTMGIGGVNVPLEEKSRDAQVVSYTGIYDTEGVPHTKSGERQPIQVNMQVCVLQAWHEKMREVSRGLTPRESVVKYYRAKSGHSCCLSLCFVSLRLLART